jgi:hypothetical protein
MSLLEDAKTIVGRLSLSERAEFARWFHGWTDDDWDRQIAADANAGKLDELIAEADHDAAEGRLRELP